MNPMVDGWRGDDWFHNGAFRQEMMSYILEQEGTRDRLDQMARAGRGRLHLLSERRLRGARSRRRKGWSKLGFWRKITEHPAYDRFWQEAALDRVLAKQPLKVPVMLVASLWDQEDIYGAPAVWRALKPKDAAGDMVYMSMGPWHHGQEAGEASNARRDQMGFGHREILAGRPISWRRSSRIT